MFIDSSAFVSLLAREPDQSRVEAAIERAEIRRTTPLVRLETAMVLTTLLNLVPEAVDASITALFREAEIDVVPITDDLARAAAVRLAFGAGGRNRTDTPLGTGF